MSCFNNTGNVKYCSCCWSTFCIVSDNSLKAGDSSSELVHGLCEILALLLLNSVPLSQASCLIQHGLSFPNFTLEYSLKLLGNGEWKQSCFRILNFPFFGGSESAVLRAFAVSTGWLGRVSVKERLVCADSSADVSKHWSWSSSGNILLMFSWL